MTHGLKMINKQSQQENGQALQNAFQICTVREERQRLTIWCCFTFGSLCSRCSASEALLGQICLFLKAGPDGDSLKPSTILSFRVRTLSSFRASLTSSFLYHSF